VSTDENRPPDPIAERRARPVVVVPYDPAWPARFDALRERLLPIVGDAAVAVEHVGSTAVPGLAARPIVDLSVVLRGVDDMPVAIARLTEAGYVHVGDLGVAGRESFIAPDEATNPHQVTLSTPGTLELQRNLTFRDALRADAALAERYGNLKRELAASFPDDLDGYIDGKTVFTKTVLADARNEMRSRKR